MKNRGIRDRVAAQDVFTNAQKDRQVTWCRRHLLTSQKLFSAKKLFSLRPGKKFGRIYVYKLVKNFYPDLLPAHPKFYSEDPSQYWAAYRIGVSVAWKRLLVPWIANIMWRKHWKKLRPSIDLLYAVGDCIFQQDNAPPHTARITKQWLANNSIPVLDWPPYSPDLKPIEHVWGHLKQKLYISMPSTPYEVMNTFLSLWNELRTQYAESLVFSIHSRMDIIQTKN